MPFPQDAKIAFIDVNMIAGDLGGRQGGVEEADRLHEKKRAEINEKNKQLQALTTKRDTGGAVLNDSGARARSTRTSTSCSATSSSRSRTPRPRCRICRTSCRREFQKRLIPVIEEVAKEKGLHAVFSVADSGAAYVHAGLNISEEVVKRLDAAAARNSRIWRIWEFGDVVIWR